MLVAVSVTSSTPCQSNCAAGSRNVCWHCRQFPRVGAYWACALKGSGDRVEAILAADSLMPPGNGKPLSEQDRLAATIVPLFALPPVVMSLACRTLIMLEVLPVLPHKAQRAAYSCQHDPPSSPPPHGLCITPIRSCVASES